MSAVYLVGFLTAAVLLLNCLDFRPGLSFGLLDPLGLGALGHWPMSWVAPNRPGAYSHQCLLMCSLGSLPLSLLKKKTSILLLIG